MATFYLAIATGRAMMIDMDAPIPFDTVMHPTTFDWRYRADIIEPISKVSIDSMDHLNPSILQLLSPEFDQWQAIVLNINRIAWCDILNTHDYQKAFEGAGVPGTGSCRQREREMLFAWAFPALMVPSPGLRLAIQRKRERTGLSEQSPFIGVHIRVGKQLGDPVRHRESDIDKFAECVKNVSRVIGDHPVFLACDDDDAKQLFLKAVPGSVTDSVPPFHIDKPQGDHLSGTLNAWAEFMLLSESSCNILSNSGFSYWPTVLSRDPDTGARCFARYDRCSQELIQDAAAGREWVLRSLTAHNQ